MRKLLKIVALVIGLVIAVFLAASAFLPRTGHVERSIVINGPQEQVFAYAADLGNFNRWDPGPKSDPATQVQVRGSGLGAEYEWRSRKNGHGKVTITSLEPPGAIRGRLEFWVTCMFDQDYPYLLRFLSLCMDGILGPQYEQSLASLKSELEALPPVR